MQMDPRESVPKTPIPVGLDEIENRAPVLGSFDVPKRFVFET
jgi:hypothetical protein